MLELTTTQIGARIGRSERTVLRYIELGKLPAQAARRHGYYLVDEHDLERLTSIEPDELTALKSEIEELKDRVGELEQIVADLTSSHARSTKRPSNPAGTSARRFAEDHGISRDRMEGWIMRNEIETTLVPYGSRTQHQLTQEQQARIVAWWESQGIPFQRCLQCPHTSDTA